jgi:hypothetical protein
MKTQSKNLFSPLSKLNVETLALQVKETLALGFGSHIPKSFSTTDLWNIQRNQRTLMSRRRYI